MQYGSFMMGAQSRLLPPSVPFRFFGMATLFHVAAWGVIALFADDIVGFQGGLGPALTAIHFITLGVLTMTAIGAAFQLLPVATGKAMLSPRACTATFWYFIAGIVLLTSGMAIADWPLLMAGGALVILGLASFGRLVALNLRDVTTMPVVTLHVWVALASLAVVAGLGGALVGDYRWGWLPDHGATVLIHLVLATYGFMGILVQGFSFVLIPMFGLSSAANDGIGRKAVTVWCGALLAFTAGTLMSQPMVLVAAGGLGLVAAGLHLWCMHQVMKARMRRHLGDSFLLIRLAWILLPTSLIVAIVAALGGAPAITLPLFVFVLIFGWLLTFLLGVLQRIMPFLASMHSAKLGRKPVLVSTLTANRPLRIHLLCHGLALMLVAAGLIAKTQSLIQLGGTVGVVGGISFTTFAWLLWRRLSHHLYSLPSPSK